MLPEPIGHVSGDGNWPDDTTDTKWKWGLVCFAKPNKRSWICRLAFSFGDLCKSRQRAIHDSKIQEELLPACCHSNSFT